MLLPEAIDPWAIPTGSLFGLFCPYRSDGLLKVCSDGCIPFNPLQIHQDLLDFFLVKVKATVLYQMFPHTLLRSNRPLP